MPPLTASSTPLSLLSCFQWPWIKAGKPVLNTEYFTTRCMYCTQANLMDMSTIKKVPDLTACRVSHSR